MCCAVTRLWICVLLFSFLSSFSFILIVDQLRVEKLYDQHYFFRLSSIVCIAIATWSQFGVVIIAKFRTKTNHFFGIHNLAIARLQQNYLLFSPFVSFFLNWHTRQKDFSNAQKTEFCGRFARKFCLFSRLLGDTLCNTKMLCLQQNHYIQHTSRYSLKTSLNSWK